MYATLSLPAPETTARRAAVVYEAWAADPEMPDVSGCAEDAVRVLAVRAAVAETAGGVQASALTAPAVVELTARLLVSQFPELPAVIERTGHGVIDGADGARWEPDGYLHRAYTGAFGQVTGRHWPV